MQAPSSEVSPWPIGDHLGTVCRRLSAAQKPLYKIERISDERSLLRNRLLWARPSYPHSQWRACHYRLVQLERDRSNRPFSWTPKYKLKGEVRTINDRNICERRIFIENNGKSPTFKFVSGEKRRPSEVQRVSRSWRLPGAMHSSVDLTWIRKWLEIQAPELSELESVELELGSCCSDLDKQVLDEICRTRKRQFEIPFRVSAASCPRVTSCSIPAGRLTRKRRRTDQQDFYQVPQHHKP